MLVGDDVSNAAQRRQHAVVEALSKRAIEDFVAQGDPYAIRHTVQVTSLGGSGTTALSASFIAAGLDLPPGPGQWPHKHLRNPPAAADVPEGFRVIYPISDPRDAVLSVFRRGIQDGHWRALRGIDPEVPTPSMLADLDAFLATGEDGFDLLGHLTRWIDHPPGYPVMFVRFDLIDSGWDDVAAFAGLPQSHPRVRYETRASDWRTESPEVRARLEEIYDPVAELIASFPATKVI